MCGLLAILMINYSTLSWRLGDFVNVNEGPIFTYMGKATLLPVDIKLVELDGLNDVSYMTVQLVFWNITLCNQ